MTDIAAIRKAMTPEPWQLGPTFDAATFVNAGAACVAKCDARRHAADAQAIALAPLGLEAIELLRDLVAHLEVAVSDTALTGKTYRLLLADAIEPARGLLAKLDGTP